MKRITSVIITLIAIGLNAQSIEWKSIEEAEKLQKNNPSKPLFIDVYTDWCGWCVKMDKTTFKDKQVVEKINKNYIPVKLDAETKDKISFKGHTFTYVAAGNRGINTLAYNLLQGQMSFPSYVVLTGEGTITNIMRGYYSASEILAEL